MTAPTTQSGNDHHKKGDYDHHKEYKKVYYVKQEHDVHDKKGHHKEHYDKSHDYGHHKGIVFPIFSKFPIPIVKFDKKGKL